MSIADEKWDVIYDDVLGWWEVVDQEGFSIAAKLSETHARAIAALPELARGLKELQGSMFPIKAFINNLLSLIEEEK